VQNVSEEFKTAIMSPSPEFESRITFPSLALDDVQIKTIELNSLLVSGNDFEIGTAPMDMVKIELVYDPDDSIEYDFEGKECDIELGLTLPDESVEYVSIGKFTVEKASRGSMTITLDCVDRMYKAEKEYISDLMYPTTLLDILQSASGQAGITLATTTFANSDYIVPNEPVFEGVTCRRVFAQVAELAGGYAKINRLGALEIITLGNESVRDITKDHYFDLKINEVAEASIDKVIVKVGEETATKGDGENIYTIVDNMFVQNPSNVIGPVFNVLKDVSYTACDFNWQGDFSLDLGDKIDIDGHETYILDRKIKYTGGLREDYKAPAKSNVERNSTGKSNLILDMNNVKTQIKVIEGEITQTIEKVENLVVDAANRLYQSQTQIPFNFNQGTGTIQLYRGAYHPYYKVVSDTNIDLSASFPQSQYAEDLTGEEVTISLDVLVDVDRVVTLDGKEFEVKGNRWTRIHVTKEFPENSTVNKRVRIPYSRKNTKDKIIENKLIDSLSTDTNTIYYRNLQVQKGNMPTNWTLTPEELEGQINRYESEIRQLADEISLTVRKGDIISEINQTAEEVRILAEKIKFEGLVTANDNFKILEDGSIEAKNATIEGDITSENAVIKGEVTATSGKVGGYSISGNNLVGNDVTLGQNEIKIGNAKINNNFLGSIGDNALCLDASRIQFGDAKNTWVVFDNKVVIRNTGDFVTASFGVITPAGGTALDWIGTSSQRWNNIYLVNQPDVSSDVRQKSLIQDIPKDLLSYLKEIKPKMYRQNDKWHFGYIAQDVERAIYKYALNKVGFKDAWDLVKEFAFLAKDESYMSLLYGEIAVLKEKEMQNRINELEERIFKLEKIINEK
jgi:hypothetical protein